MKSVRHGQAPPDPGSRSHALPLAVISGVALALRLLHVWQLRRSPFFDVLLGDARGYDEWAVRIASGDWIGRDVFYQAPLYPYFLGVIYRVAGHSLLAVRIVQAAIGAGSAALLYLAGARFISTRAGWVAGLALAVYAPAIFFDSLLQKSVLDVFFLTLGLSLAGTLQDRPERRGRWLALGLAMGALSLTRENALVFILVIAAWGLVGARPLAARLQTLAAFAAGLALVLMPVAVRNYAVGGGFYLTTSQFGPNFYIGNNPKADGTYMSLRFGRGAPEFERQDAIDLAEHALGRTLTPAEVSGYWTDRALAFITGQPGRWMALMGRKAALLVNRDEMLDTESQESYAEWSWPLRLLGWFGHFGVLVPLAVLGAILGWPDRQRLALLYGMTALYAASVLLFYVFARYRLPLLPLLLLFAAHAVTALVPGGIFRGIRLQPDSQRQKLRSRWIPIAAAVTAVAVAANWPLLSPRLMQAITETNLATALNERGRRDEAIAHFARAAQLAPGYAPAYNNLGAALKAGGAIDEAIATYRQALTVQPDYPDAHYNLANALLAQNKFAEAEDHFNIALRTIPDSAGVRNNLGVALSAQGNRDAAVAAFQAAVAADPRSAKAYRNLGSALSDAGRTDEAIVALRQAAALDPKDAGIEYDLGSVLLEANRLDDAIAAFQAALALDPRMVAAHNNLGIALGQRGDLRGAIAAFEKALALDPQFTDAQRNLATARSALPR